MTINIAVLVVLVVDIDTGGVKKKEKRKTYLLRWACSRAWIHGHWGGLVVDIGTELGGGNC